jgi:hypothetical protein
MRGLEGCHRCNPDRELEGGNKVRRRFEEGDRGGHNPKTGRSALEGGGLEKESERRGGSEE